MNETQQSNSVANPYQVGKAYYVRVGGYETLELGGILESATETELVLYPCAEAPDGNIRLSSSNAKEQVCRAILPRSSVVCAIEQRESEAAKFRWVIGSPSAPGPGPADPSAS